VGAFAAVGAWPGVLASLVAGHDLDPEVATGALERILAGEATDAQIAGFLIGLRSKGESPEEVAGLVDAMLAAAAPLELDDPDATVDIVGTGGSKALGGRAFNVSTMASIVAAAAGATVCKHGNRRASSTSGSTDLLEALGVEVDLDGPGVHACVREAGVGFAFARMFHPAMRHVGPVRTELGIPTVFNLLGPLSHPGRVGRQVLGVTDADRVELVAGVLARRGVRRAWVVRGADGLDELTTTDESEVIDIADGVEVARFRVVPEDLGLARVDPEDIAVGDPQANADAANGVLEAQPGPVRDMVVLNAAAALVVADVADDLPDGLVLAARAIDSGDAARTLGALVATSRAITGSPD
jgi:anthranilate phosphoribosyltransferase